MMPQHIFLNPVLNVVPGEVENEQDDWSRDEVDIPYLGPMERDS
jgi:hypothetical protein